MNSHGLCVGFLINPLAGLGGSLALKGSDGDDMRQLAKQLLATEGSRSAQRALRALSQLPRGPEQPTLLCAPGIMGADIVTLSGLAFTEIGELGDDLPSANDTKCVAQAMRDAGADLVVFAGGDGTARDIVDAVGSQFPVLGIPAGVKMHSGVFAVSPEAAGELLAELARAGLVDLALQEVRDIDEQAFRHNRVRTRFYGDLLVPSEGRFMQHTKVSGVESQELVAAEIAAWVVETMKDDHLYLIGPGSTTAAIMEELGLENTLLGVDIVKGRERIAGDASEEDILRCLSDHPGVPVEVYVTVIGGQGHIFGRGNQQLSPRVLRAIDRDNIHVIAAKSKIKALQGRPLLVDTNDAALDRSLAGYRAVITGYDNRILYPVSNP